MSLLHELGVELRNQRKDSIHVLDSFIQSRECFPALDFFVLRVLRVSLFGLHVLD
jgi:hypothetical protein